MNLTYTLVVVEVGSIQSYIFGSNRLAENLGASYLVDAATSEWAFKAVTDSANDHNVTSSNSIDKTKYFEKHNLDAEVIYSGGGNFVVIFRDELAARRFGRALSQRVLEDAAGMQLLVTVSAPYEWEKHALAQQVRELRRTLKSTHAASAQSAPLLGLSVTAACRSTGLPAVGSDEDGLFSAEIGCKTGAVSLATKRLIDALGLSERFAFTNDLGELGGSEGDTNYIAVVHADGNGIGEWLGEQVGVPSDNREYITKQREASTRLANLSVESLGRVMRRVESWMEWVIQQPKNKRPLDLSKENRDGGRWIIPVRPIVFGGDDLTVVCDGRIGVQLAVDYLAAFEEVSGLSACAGVSIVKSHYPFARAYALADDLISGAKKFRRGDNSDSKKTLFQGSALDWHIATSGLSGDLDDIREREYAGLTARPIALANESDARGKTWTNVGSSVSAFTNDQDWGARRNKAKALHDALREGEAAVGRFMTLFGVNQLPNIITSTGRLDYHDVLARSLYFDALELADMYVRLEVNHA